MIETDGVGLEKQGRTLSGFIHWIRLLFPVVVMFGFAVLLYYLDYEIMAGFCFIFATIGVGILFVVELIIYCEYKDIQLDIYKKKS